MNNRAWYSVRCILEHRNFLKEDGVTTYEERVVLLRADSLDDAIVRGEEEANEYADGLSGVSYSGFIDAYHMFAKEIKDKTEVFSLMRESNLERAEYLTHFFNSGTERSQGTQTEETTDATPSPSS